MKPARLTLLILAFVALGALAFGMWRGVSAYSAGGARIDEQVALIEGYLEEKAALGEEVLKVGNEMAALPDSVRSLQTGKVVGAATSIAKREAHLDGLIQRAERRIENAALDQASAVKQMAVWGATAGLPFLVLILVFVRTGRRPV